MLLSMLRNNLKMTKLLSFQIKKNQVVQMTTAKNSNRVTFA